MIWIILGSVLGALLILLFLLLFYIYRVTFYSPKPNQNDEYYVDPSFSYEGSRGRSLELIKEILSKPYEDLYCKSYDGLKLHAYFYINKNSNHYVLMFNGYRGTPRRDFSGGSHEVMELGKNVLLIDQRAHGKSEGHSITFGRKEQYDVVAWVNYVKEKFGSDIKITVVGISMGGATVLMASDKLSSDINVIADCPYSREKDVIKFSLKKLGFPPTIFWPLSFLSALIFCRARLVDDAAVNVSKSKSKILIIHGTKDLIVPHEMSERVYLANKDKVQYEKFEGVNHALSYLKDTERYKELVKQFLENK